MKKLIYAFMIAMPAFSAPAATEIRDTEIESALYEMVRPLADAAEIPDGRLRVHIMDSDEFNAFVAGGEEVFIYTGLIRRVESPGAMQAVIAHEMGHMLGGHMTQMAAQARAELKRALVVQALGVALMVANPMAGVGVLAGAGGLSRQSLLAFTRDEERIADNMGLDLMVRAGLNPGGFVDVMRQMNDMHGALESRVNPNDSNHPFTSERLKNIRERIKELPAAEYRAPDAGKYSLVRAKLTGYLASTDQVRNQYPPKDKSTPAIYARAIAAMRAGDLQSARSGTLTLVTREKDNPYFYELLGDLEFQYGRYDDSAAAYEKSLELIGAQSAPQIRAALGLALLRRNRPGDMDRAIEMAKRALLSDQLPLAYWVLSGAEMSRGNKGLADWAMAEYYALLRAPEKSREYARKARSELPENSPEYIKSGDLLK